MSDIESRIDKLERTINELRNELRTLRVLVRTDYPSALNKIRFITEKILGQLCKEHHVTWGNAEPTLENMIGPLISKQIIPRPIVIHVRSIQTNSSPGSHFQETPLSATHLEIAQIALVEFLEWYYSTHPNPVPVVVDDALERSRTRAPLQNDSGEGGLGRSSGKRLRNALVGIAAFVVVASLIYYALFHKPDHHDSMVTTQHAATQTAATNPASLQIAASSPMIYVDPPVDDDARPIADVCNEWEPRIKNYVGSNNFLDAITIVGDYQLALLKLYAPPTFGLGLFQSPSHGISCKMADFTAWTQHDEGIARANDDASKSAGIETLLSIQGATKSDHIMIICADYESQYSKMNISAAGMADESSTILSNEFMRYYGNIAFGNFEQTGELRTLHVNISDNPSYDVQGAAFFHDGLTFGVVCMSAPGDHDINVTRMNSILHAITFPKNTQTLATVDLIKAQVTNPKDVGQLLTAVRRIAMLRQYRGATRELSSLIGVLAADMPRPVIDADVATDSTFGVRVKNPDPQKWKLNTLTMGTMNALTLTPKTSSKMQLIETATMNPVIMFGARATDFLGPQTSADDLKGLLRSGGEGALITSRVAIDAEKYGTFHDLVSYQGEGQVLAFGVVPTGVWERVVIVARPNNTLLVALFLGNKEELDNAQALLSDNLTLTP